ncbi:serine/arginine regulated nuclear matrix protein, putative [Entamoeba dispar SAW760]|uniref:Serine/arginine regulated nuclear matrix protein, putative n=1 Tax=Entamoeba dispar (strain ATCC PRA-260 / SAW760) TaxID=370354 RepID=B0E6K9_ENTDS|nr:serine/arginine regulated nuclear matrix protein, putative [Entamoeba dispar SAW760]EDR29842.1 serine/arginine regulated nuclear matrix protein, putative [Entamoeba dispar SAW760]|eukprot:EDR29842.1 serine/arginine regulated nuclear matrix protein, putative [Entamoeba dispar SAW760]
MFKGTSIEQDPHFSDKREKLKKSMTFPENFYQKVDFNKVNIEVMRAWITSKIIDILEVDDDILVNTIVGFIEENGNETDPRDLEIDLEAFLGDKTNEFVEELWGLCQMGEKSKDGIPECLKKAAEEREARKRRDKEKGGYQPKYRRTERSESRERNKKK